MFFLYILRIILIFLFAFLLSLYPMKHPERIYFSSLNDISNAPSDIKTGSIHACKNFAMAYHIRPFKFLNSFITPGMPYRIDDFRFVLFHKAGFQLNANLHTYHVTDGAIGFMGNGGIIQFDCVPERIEVSALLMPYEYMRYVMNGRMYGALGNNLRDFAIWATEREFAIAEQMLSVIFSLTEDSDYDEKTVESLIAGFVHYIMNLYEKNSHDNPQAKTRAEAVFNEFVSLVNEHCTKHHTLGYYAGRLCITERYLGTLVRQASGVSAKEWIDRALIAEAKVALCHSDVSIGALAEQLNFPNVPFFCKYFKRLTGVTPSAFRHSQASEHKPIKK